MNLYLLTNNTVPGEDTWNAIVVAAENDDAARKIHPLDAVIPNPNHWNGKSWPKDPKDVEVKLLGTAGVDIEAGVILSDYQDH